MKNHIHKIMRLNTKNSEEDRYVKKKKDNLNLPEGFEWKNNKKGTNEYGRIYNQNNRKCY